MKRTESVFMKYRVIASLLFLIGIFEVLGAVAGAQRNEQTRQITILQDMLPVGLVYGQSLRISVFNPAAQSPQNDGRKFKMVVAPLILDASGNVVAQADEVEVEPGQFHAFDFKRDALPLSAEFGTGRVEVRARIRYRSFAIIDRTQFALPSLEIIDDSTGRTVWSGGVTVAVADVGGDNGGVPAHVFADSILGIVPGQTLRANIFNTNQRTPVKGRVQIFAPSGALIVESVELVIRPGEFRSIDLNRTALPGDGEPGTGRLQVRATLLIKSDDHSLELRPVPASLEVIDNLTGRTEPVGTYIAVIQTLHCSSANGQENCRIVSHPVPIP